MQTLEFRNKRVFRGDRVVAEFEPRPGRADEYRYTNLITRSTGTCSSLGEVKERLTRELASHAEAYSRAESIRTAALQRPGRVSHTTRAAASETVECPHCDLAVSNLSLHLRDVHGVGSRRALPQRRPPVPNRRTDLIACSFCDARVAPEKLDGHVARVHEAKRAPMTQSIARPTGASKLEAPPKPGRDRVLCTYCGAFVNRANTGRHATRCPKRNVPIGTTHEPTPASPPKGSTGPKRRPSSVTVCQECGQRVRKSELTRHCAAHTAKRRLNAARADARVRASHSPPGNEPRRWDPALGPSGRRAERALDGAREYGHTFREHGRFGSHASYDDYGEDSDA